MKIEIRITIGSKIITNSYSEPDDLFFLRRFPRQTIDRNRERVGMEMSEAVDRAIRRLAQQFPQ